MKPLIIPRCLQRCFVGVCHAGERIVCMAGSYSEYSVRLWQRSLFVHRAKQLYAWGGMAGAMVVSSSAWAESAGETKSQTTVADPMSMGNLTEVTLGLLAVLVVIFLVAWLAKRFGSFNTTMGGNLRVVGGVSVGQRERVLLVQVGDKQMLIGVAPGRVSMLHVLDEPIALEERVEDGDNFSQRLQAALNQRLKK